MNFFEVESSSRSYPASNISSPARMIFFRKNEKHSTHTRKQIKVITSIVGNNDIINGSVNYDDKDKVIRERRY